MGAYDNDDDDGDGVDTVTMTPCSDAVCYVNGILVTETVTLKTGSRVIFGRTHVFRFMQPNQGRPTHLTAKHYHNILTRAYDVHQSADLLRS